MLCDRVIADIIRGTTANVIDNSYILYGLDFSTPENSMTFVTVGFL